MTLLPAPLAFTTAGVLDAEADGATAVGTAIVVDRRVVEFWKVTLVLETDAEVEVETGAEVEVEEVVAGAEVEVEVEEMVLEDERVEEVEVDAKVEIWEIWTVLVTLPERIVNGCEYWKVVGAESSWSLMP